MAMLQACLNGGRSRRNHSGVPVTPEQIASDAKAAFAAGASEFHFHPRGPDELESLAADAIAAAIDAVRSAVPGAPIGLSTHAGIPPGGAARIPFLRTWHRKPDYVSVNLVEEDAPEVMAIMRDMGIGIEAGIWSVADARRFVALPGSRHCLRILIEINEQDIANGLQAVDGILDVLKAAGIYLPILLHGLDEGKWPFIREAHARGFDTRVGLEDGFTMPDGTRASGNAAQVAAARALARTG